MKLRYTILILFTVFLFGTLFGMSSLIFHLEFENYRYGTGLAFLTLSAFLGLLLTCALAVEKHPELVRRILLLLLFILVLLVIPMLALPTIT